MSPSSDLQRMRNDLRNKINEKTRKRKIKEKRDSDSDNDRKREHRRDQKERFLLDYCF